MLLRSLKSGFLCGFVCECIACLSAVGNKLIRILDSLIICCLFLLVVLLCRSELIKEDISIICGKSECCQVVVTCNHGILEILHFIVYHVVVLDNIGIPCSEVYGIVIGNIGVSILELVCILI